MLPQQTFNASLNVENRKNVKNNRRCNRKAEKSSVETTSSCFLGFAPAVALAHVGCYWLAFLLVLMMIIVVWPCRCWMAVPGGG